MLYTKFDVSGTKIGPLQCTKGGVSDCVWSGGCAANRTVKRAPTWPCCAIIRRAIKIGLKKPPVTFSPPKCPSVICQLLRLVSKVPSCFWYYLISRGFSSSSLTDLSTPQTCLYTVVTYKDTQDQSTSDPSYTEWEICWPIATWYISWHAAICLSVVSLPSHLFRLECGFPRSPALQTPDLCPPDR
ncbi:hypothetical protein BJV74DRAFT_519622 [Russula compacta]|nr:hypothetical protein BJV74DRAFT_519622 [Russula compacta]